MPKSLNNELGINKVRKKILWTLQKYSNCKYYYVKDIMKYFLVRLYLTVGSGKLLLLGKKLTEANQAQLGADD